MTEAMFIVLIVMCLSDFKQRTKANFSRLLLIALLVAVLGIKKFFFG